MEHLNDSISAGERVSMGFSRRRTPQQPVVVKRDGNLCLYAVLVYHKYTTSIF